MNHVRHIDLFSIPPTFTVEVIGVGGIGSVAALVLAKMGVQQIALADFDTVQPENLATQLHRVSDVGKLKVDCVAETLRMFSDEITTLARPIRIINGDQLTGNLVVGAVDGIQTRKQVWAAALAGRVDWFLDTRMAAEEYQHFLVDMSNDDAIRNYDNQLARLTDENVPDAPCTSKATMYCAFMSAGHIGAVLKAIVTGEAISRRPGKEGRNPKLQK